jgi:hypothetical protein
MPPAFGCPPRSPKAGQQGVEDALLGAASARSALRSISFSRSIFTAMSARSRMMDSTSRPT